MQKLLEDTQTLYRNFLEHIEDYIISTVGEIKDGDAKDFLVRLRSAKRIFFTAAGSSIPSALMGTLYCSEKMNLPAQYIPTGNILSMQFDTLDVIVLCTQGFNRGDSILVTQKALQDKAQLVVFTANKESAHTSKADSVFYFSPFPEKLFCRPVGVITGLIAMLKTLMPDFVTEEALKASRAGSAMNPILFEEKCKYIVLASGWGNPVGFNVALALREGCGLDASFYDIETYGHGLYVSDQRLKSKGNNVKYIIVNIKENVHSDKAVERILPFIKATDSKYQILSSMRETPYAHIEILAHLAHSIYHSNEHNQYDMNDATGKEENRYYHNEGTYLL